MAARPYEGMFRPSDDRPAPNFVTGAGIFMMREGTFVTREGIFMMREGTFVTREGSFVTHEGTFVMREGIFVTRDRCSVMHEGSLMMRDGFRNAHSGCRDAGAAFRAGQEPFRPSRERLQIPLVGFRSFDLPAFGILIISAGLIWLGIAMC